MTKRAVLKKRLSKFMKLNRKDQLELNYLLKKIKAFQVKHKYESFPTYPQYDERINNFNYHNWFIKADGLMQKLLKLNDKKQLRG